MTSGVSTDPTIGEWPTLGDAGETLHLVRHPGRQHPTIGDRTYCGLVWDGTSRFPSQAAVLGSGLPKCPRCARHAF